MSLFACFGGRKRSSRAVDFWDCSNLGLTDLPKEVQQHRKTLRQLFMSNNNIRDVPKSLFTCEHLTELDLSENMILFLPPSIQALRFLTSLNISKNSLSTVPDSIRECQDLLYLDISSNSLGGLPDGVTELRQLRTLLLNDCQLEELPPNIGRLNKLEVLELRENLISSLPQSMCHMTLLEKLDLGVNELETLSGMVGALESLSELWLDGNLLHSLPDEIGSLRNLKFLEVSENQLMSLPLTISGLVSLQDLYLPDNLIPLLPESIGELGNLKMLKIERNRLSALPETIYGWKNMVELSASHNHMEEIPAGIGALKKLDILNLDENSLFSLPPEVGQLTSLTLLSVRDNNLVELPPEVGHLKKLTILNLVGNRLQNLPYSLTFLDNLTAVWIAENQNRPLLDLQLSRDQGGEKVLTCILLPQHGMEPPFEEPSQAATAHETKTHVSSVNFDPKVQDRKSNLTRDPTPYPKELHIKALQWRAMREEMGGGTPERVGAGNVDIRHGRRALHRPYSLIRAMSDPIDEDNLFPHSHRGSRRRDSSRERGDHSLSPPIRTQSPQSPPYAAGEGERKGHRGSRTHSSPSPPPLLVPSHERDKAAGLPPDHQADYPVRMLPNGQYASETQAGSYRDALSPTLASGSDDHTALLANSNSSNGNWHSSVPVRMTAKSSTFPLAGHHPPPPISPPRLYYQSNAQGHSETSTLSRSDVPDPRCSSSMESGFDADVEQDQHSPWYVTSDSPPDPSNQRGQHKRRFLSDSSTNSAATARQGRRRGSAGDDYDHLRDRNEGRGKKPFPKLGYKGSPIATGKPKIQVHSINYQHKASRSFDTAESAARGKHAAALPKSELHFARPKTPQKSYTAAMKGKKGNHARSRSQPEELVRLGTSMPAIAGQRSARGSQSPTHLVSYHVRSTTPTQQPRRRIDNFPRAHSPSVTQRHAALQEDVIGEDGVFQSPSHDQRRPGSVSPARRHHVHSPVRPFSPTSSSASASTAGSNHPRSGSHRQQIEEDPRARRGRERDREREGSSHVLPDHQRFPSDSYYTSDESQGLGQEPSNRRTPTKGCATWGVSQDSGFDSMKRNALSPPPGSGASSTGTVFKVELVRDPTFGLGITGGIDGNNTIKPGDTSYHIYKVADGSPAQRCGKIKVGDKLLEANEIDVSALKTSELLSLLNSETHVSLTLYREPSMTLL